MDACATKIVMTFVLNYLVVGLLFMGIAFTLISFKSFFAMVLIHVSYLHVIGTDSKTCSLCYLNLLQNF